MGGWNRPRHVRRGHHDRRPHRPPLPHGQECCSVPLWEREFCCYVGNISWKRFCENKQYIGFSHDIDHWDDSGALEDFKNAKARFWTHYHGQPFNVPLPDPDMYIDKVDHGCKIDFELVADLDKVGLPFDSDNNSAVTSEADKKSSQNQSGNWDVYIEKPAEINRWKPELTSSPNAAWGVKHEPSDYWCNSNSGWGNALPLENPSWRNSSNDYYFLNIRKQSSRGHFRHMKSWQRNQAEGYQRSGWQDRREGCQRSSDWQEHRRRNREWRPFRNRNYENGQGPESGF